MYAQATYFASERIHDTSNLTVCPVFCGKCHILVTPVSASILLKCTILGFAVLIAIQYCLGNAPDGRIMTNISDGPHDQGPANQNGSRG